MLTKQQSSKNVITASNVLHLPYPLFFLNIYLSLQLPTTDYSIKISHEQIPDADW